MNSKYHILWIDDEWDSMTSFKKHCLFEYQMELHPFKTQKEGLDDYAKHPDFYESDGIHASSAYYPYWLGMMANAADLDLDLKGTAT